MPIKNRPDPNYESPDRKTFDDGKYKVNGIVWVTMDDADAPIFKVRKNSATLYSVYRMALVNGEDGPPGSVTPGEVPLLVRAFGADPTKLPDKESDPTAYLISAKTLINATMKELQVTVKGGWVQDVPGMSLPADSYHMFEISRINTKNDEGEISWIKGEYGPFFAAEMVVVANMHGKPSMYDGARISTFVSYGMTVDAEGDPTFEKTSDGGWTSAAVATSKFLAAFVPSAYELSFTDPSNILPEVWEEYTRNRRRGITMVSRNKKGRIIFNMKGLVPADTELPPMDAPEESRDVADEATEPDIMRKIYALIDEKAGGGAFGSDGKLTPKGKTWCKGDFKAFIKANGYKASFDAWDDKTRVAVLAFLRGEEEDEF